MRSIRLPTAALVLALAGPAAHAAYVNFESSHVHPIDLTPAGSRLLVVNTPDASLEVFALGPDGEPTPHARIPVGLEPVSVVARTENEAWVVNQLSDSVSIVDLGLGATVRTLVPGDEPTDVVFAAGRAFVAVSERDAVAVYDLANLTAAPVALVPLFTRDVRALAVSQDGSKVYAVALESGNQTTVVNVEVTFPGASNLTLDGNRLAALGLRDITCAGAPPYPQLPPGVQRNPALVDPPSGVPPVGLIVGWDLATGRWIDDAEQDWTPCLPYRLPDHDLFVIDAATLTVSAVDHLGTSLFDVAVHPGNGRIYVPHTEARNRVRFEHTAGVRGHVVDNRMAIVDPAQGNAVTLVDLNAHIDRGSDPATNHAERNASISQPGMMVFAADGSKAYLTAIGTRKLFRLDGACLAAPCIFGPDRATPAAVEVGEGPTGVALDEPRDRLYVLNRIDHSLAVVEASTLTLVGDVTLHDPSPAATRDGRRFLYDAIDTSGHGDAACSSCHLSGDLDGLAWDLGAPQGGFVPYATANDNVRFVIPLGGNPVNCNPALCASHDGFDPQKGPMTTQTLRGMLEPLHWRGDRATMNDFNGAFVELLGKADVAPEGGKPQGLTAQEMEAFRQFALGLRFPPNPHRRVDDTLPCGRRGAQPDPACEVTVHGSLFPGNPTEGAFLFDNHPSDAGQPCRSCHTHPFGAGGGALGGVAPVEPTSPAAAALFNGNADGSPHSDLKIPHLRNMHEKFGPVWPAPGAPPSVTKTGFGHVHDGSIPDLFRFLSATVFNLNAVQLRDVASFMFHFPTGTRPAVGRQVTLPAGTPPTGSTADEVLLTTLVALGDRAQPGRHCELVASTIEQGRSRSFHLNSGSWVTDVGGEPPRTLLALRQAAGAPLTFTCVTIDSGPRLGGNRDEDPELDGDDCAASDASSWGEPPEIAGLELEDSVFTQMSWVHPLYATGPGLRFDVLGGSLTALRQGGFGDATCLAGGLLSAGHDDSRVNPAPGDGYWYLVRSRNGCGPGSAGAGTVELEALDCR